MSRKASQGRALAALGSDPCKPIAAILHDARHIGVGLDVVDVGGLAPYPGRCGEGRLIPRHGPLAFHRLHQRRLLARDIGLSRERDLDVEGEIAPHDVLPKEARCVGVIDSLLYPGDGKRPAGPDEDEAFAPAGLGGVAPNGDAFHHLVWVALQQVLVVECPRIPLFGIAEVILGRPGRPEEEAPLQGAREGGAAPASQIGLPHLLDDLLRLHLENGLPQPLVAAVGDVMTHVRRIDDPAILGGDPPLQDELRTGKKVRKIPIVGPGDAKEHLLGHTALGHAFVDQPLRRFRSHIAEEHARRARHHDADDDLGIVEAEAPRLVDISLDIPVAEGCLQGFPHLGPPGRQPVDPHPHEDLRTARLQDLVPGGCRLLLELREVRHARRAWRH